MADAAVIQSLKARIILPPQAGSQMTPEILCRDHRIIAANVFRVVFDDARVDQAGIFLSLKFENGIVHHGAVANVQADQHSTIRAATRPQAGTPSTSRQ